MADQPNPILQERLESKESGYVTNTAAVEATPIVQPFPNTPTSSDSLISFLPVTIPQQSSIEYDDNIQQCSSQSVEVAYVEELIKEYPSANIAFLGWPASTVAGDESMIIEDDSNSTATQECQDETPLQSDETPLQSDETQSQQESKGGAELPATILLSKINPICLGDIVTGNRSTTSAIRKDKENKVCNAVHEYYMHQFVDRWKKKTKQGSSTITVIAALLVEKNKKFKVVVFTAGTKVKQKCSYLVEGSSIQDATWGLCDGHAIAVCYRLVSLYLTTEIYKLHESEESIFSKTAAEGYALKPEINFHLFTSQPPCGFMTTEEQHLLSWKCPFLGKPHCLQCSSIILIGSYLGIQGPLSHLLTKPIYISSVTIPRYETVDTLHGTSIREKFERFQHQFTNVPPESQYHFNPPHIEIVNKDPKELFLQCYKPHIEEKPMSATLINKEIPQQETSTRARQARKGACKLAGAIPDVLKNTGITAFVFTVENGIGSEEFREYISKLKSKLVPLPYQLKQHRLQSLQEARVRLSQILNVSEALAKQKELMSEEILKAHKTRCEKVDELVNVLTKSKENPTPTDMWHEEVKISLDKANKDNKLSHIATLLSDHVSKQRMLDELDSLQEQGMHHSSSSEFYLELIGCDWARYVTAIRNDICI